MAEQHHQRSMTVQAFWLMFAKTLAFIFSFALPVLLTRTLSQNEYGLFKQVFLIITSATALLPFGFGLSAFYYLPRETDPARRAQIILNILLFNAVVGTAACLLLLFSPQLIAHIFKDPTVPTYASSIGVVIVLWLFSSVLETVAVANQELKLATIFIVLGQLTRTTLLIGAAVVFDSVHALIYAAIIHGGLQCIVLLCYVNSRFPKFWRAFDWHLTRKQIAYAVPFGFAGLLYTLQTDLHNYFVSNRFSAATFAVYSIGVAQVPLVGILRDSVSAVILPRISYLQKNDQPREIIELLANAIRKLAFVYLPIFALLLVTGREFLTVMFTSAYVQSWPIFAINLLLLPISLLEVDAIVRAYEGYRFYLLKLQLLLTVAMVIALWFGLAGFGLVGAVSVVVLINLLLRVVLAIKFSRVLDTKLRDLVLLKDVAKLGFASTVAGVLSLLVRSTLTSGGARPFSVLVICSAVFVVAYLASTFILRIPTDDEFEKARRAVARLQQLVYVRRSASSVS